jgi:LacI family transcriptional regulator
VGSSEPPTDVPGRTRVTATDGDRRTTSHDVALAAGVSQPTVSRALRGDPSVAETTRQRVLDVAQALGYVPSERGRSLSTRRSGRIGVVVEDLGNPFYFELLDALHDRLERSDNRMVVLTPGRGDPQRLERLVDGSTDGVVLTTTLLDSELPARLLDRRFPFVLLNRIVDDIAVDSCSVANIDGAASIAAALVRHRHHRIGAIFGPSNTSTGRDREIGFCQELDKHGIVLRADSTQRGPFTHETGHRAIGKLLSNRPRPTAVFCANDVIAIGALNGARALGIRVPDELSIVGFDDIAMAAWEVFQLTTVRQDLHAMCNTAIDLLLARITEPDRPPQKHVLQARLVRRATLAPAPT